MLKRWEDIKVGDVMADGSVVTQIHRTHEQEACKIIYDYNKEFICSVNHILLVDVHNLPIEGKKELEQFCTFVPLEENYSVSCNEELSDMEKLTIDKFLHNENIDVAVDCIQDGEIEIYDFHFDTIKRIEVTNVITSREDQKVDENTYWLTCNGIKYLMDKYKSTLYCNGNIINDIQPLGILPCFCISTNTGRYET